MAYIDNSNDMDTSAGNIDDLLGSPDICDDCDIPAGYAHMDDLLNIWGFE